MYKVYHIPHPENLNNINEGYVGVSVNTKERFKQHMISKYIVGNGIRKYKLTYDDIKILEVFVNKEDAYEYEKMLRPQGYIGWNINSGGDGGWGSVNDAPNYINPMSGKKHTDESKQKIKNNHTDMSGEKNPFFGETHIDETKFEMSNMKNTITRNGKTVAENASIIAMNTMNVLQDNGKTIREEAEESRYRTVMTPDETGKTIAQRGAQKSANTMKRIREDGTTIRSEANKKRRKTCEIVGEDGKTPNQRTGEGVSKAIKNRKPVKCKYCDVESRVVSNITRWHNENCKHKPIK